MTEFERPSVREIQRRPYTRLTEAMAEVALELQSARALVTVLQQQYQMLEAQYATTQNYQPLECFPTERPPYEFLGQ